MEPTALHVLIVEDSPDDRQTLRRLLTQGAPGAYTITEADQADQARNHCQADPPDCVLLAAPLPDRDVRIVLADLRAARDVPVVLLTDLVHEALAVDALQQGAQDYLLKEALTPLRLHLTLQRTVADARRAREREHTLALLDALPVGVAVLDQELHLLQVNAALTVLLGAPSAALIGQPLAASWADLAQALAPHGAQVLATGQPVGPLEVVAPAPAGAGGPQGWQVDLSPLVVPNTRGPGLALVVGELSAPIQARTALALSEQRLRQALDAAGLVAWEWDIAAGTMTFSGATREVLGFPPDRLTRTLDELAHMVYPPDRPGYAQAVAAALRDGGPYQVRFRMRTDDQRLIWVEVRGVAQHDAGGQLVRAFGVTRDISAEQQRASAQALHLAISQVLSPELDVATTLQAIARLPLPDLADTCVLSLCDDAGQVQPIAAWTMDRAAPRALTDLPALVALVGEPDRVSAVSRSGVPQLVADLPPPPGVETSGPGALRSALLVALSAEGRTFGVLQLFRTSADQPYAASDLALAEGLARRGAEALAQARLRAAAQVARQAAAEALRASQQNLAALIDNTDGKIWSLDTRYRLIAGNAHFHRDVAAVSGEELHPGTCLMTLPLPPDSLARWRGWYDRALAGETFSIEDQLRFAPAPHMVEYRFSPIRAASGAITGVTVFGRDITERLQGARALEHERQQLAAILNTMYEGVIAVRPDGTIALINPATMAMHDLDPAHPPATLEEFVQRARRRAFDAAGQPLLPDHWPLRRVLRGEQFIGQELRLRPPQSDQERWQIFNGTPVYAPDGTLILGLVTSRDITDLKRDEAALQAVQAQAQALTARLESLLAHAPVGIALLDPELCFQHINPHLAALNRLAPEAHLGRPLREVIPNLAPRLEPILQQVLATDAPVLDLELSGDLSAAPGEIRTVQASYFPVRTNGVLLGLGTVVLDITAQRQVEQALASERQQLAAIVQTLHEGLVAFTPDGTIVISNAAVRQLGNLDADVALTTLSAVGQAMGLVPVDADGQPLPPSTYPFARILRGERFANLELRMRHPARGEERWIVFSGTPVYDAQGTIVLGVVTAHDVTQRKRDALMLQTHADTLSRTNAELMRALRLKDEFLAMMSHELRTPLNVVLGITEALEEELYGPIVDRQRQALGTVTQSGRHLLAILADILDLAHLESGSAALQTERIAIEPLCSMATDLVAGAARQKGIALSRTVEVGVAALRADERRLIQILVNLLDNAIKFTPAGGRVGVEVRADRAGEQITFAVWDTGIGIAAADYARLFQPFTQVDGRLSRQYGGVGLGLSLVRRLVDLHSGSIQLESTAGQGSRFTVSLPWATADNVTPPIARVPLPEPHSWATPPRLVIADDHEGTLQFYAGLLGEQGCAVALARTGVEAVAQVRATRPDVAVLDIQMPELDGLSAIRQIRADPEVGATPIIALTALAMPGDRECCLAVGANAYLAKPVSLRALLAAIAAVLAGSTPGPTGA